MYIREKELCAAYISKINSNCQKHLILLINPNWEKEGRHYLAVIKLSSLLRRITFFAWIALILLEQKLNLNLKEKYVRRLGIVMLSGKDNILEFNQYMRTDKMPYIVYVVIESLIRKIDGSTNNSENFST